MEEVQHPETRINRYKLEKRVQTIEQVQQSTQSSRLWFTVPVAVSLERAFVGQTETQGASSQWRQVIGKETSRADTCSTEMRFFGDGSSPKAEKRFLLSEWETAQATSHERQPMHRSGRIIRSFITNYLHYFKPSAFLFPSMCSSIRFAALKGSGSTAKLAPITLSRPFVRRAVTA